jgi:hypothetical protein
MGVFMAKLRSSIPRMATPCLTALVIGLMVNSAGAQVTSAQQSAIKANCRSDFMAKCSGVTPGGKDALVCLQKNVDSLSGACKSAVSATLPPPAAADAAAPAETADTQPADETPATEAMPAQPTAAQQNALKQSCRSDFMSHCSGVTPGGKDALTCLQQNVGVLSAACKQAVTAIGAPAAPAGTVTAAPARAAVAAPAAPTAAQRDAMKQACRSDFMAKCSGVAPGGKDALVCLQRNVAGLSPACKKVVSATLGAPGAATAVAVAPAAGPTPEQLKAVKFTCRRDFIRDCRGVQPGGPEALACLQRNAPRLTPDCRTSLAALGEAAPAASAPGSTTTVIIEERRPLPPGITPAGRILRRVIERNE